MHNIQILGDTKEIFNKVNHMIKHNVRATDLFNCLYDFKASLPLERTVAPTTFSAALLGLFIGTLQQSMCDSTLQKQGLSQQDVRLEFCIWWEFYLCAIELRHGGEETSSEGGIEGGSVRLGVKKKVYFHEEEE